MNILIKERETLEINPCYCGAYPKFNRVDSYHTDLWLECPRCGNKTANTGGYHYASEIPEDTAKRNAVIAWNKGEFAN